MNRIDVVLQPHRRDRVSDGEHPADGEPFERINRCSRPIRAEAAPNLGEDVVAEAGVGDSECAVPLGVPGCERGTVVHGEVPEAHFLAARPVDALVVE